MTHGEHILTEFRKLWYFSLVGIVEFLSSFVAFIWRPEALGGILSTDKRAEQAYFGALVVIFGASSFVETRLLNRYVEELVLPVMSGATRRIIVVFDIPNYRWQHRILE